MCASPALRAQQGREGLPRGVRDQLLSQEEMWEIVPLLRYPIGLGYTYCYGMKTAISVPDEIYEGAERLARRTKKSRSRLFSDALKEYLARHAPDEVTEAMNRACAEAGQTTDPFVSSAARRILERSDSNRS
jgi:predicted transcriptional regulator